MPDANNHDIWERVRALETLVTNSLASREWVRGELGAIREAAIRTENSVEAMSKQMSALAEDLKNIYSTQDAMMKDRAEREKQEHDARMAALKEQTFVNIIKERWAPVSGFIVGIAAVVALVGELLKSWLTSHGVPIK